MSLPPGVTVAVLLSSRPEAFGLPLELLAGAEGLDRAITSPHIQKTGLALAGFHEYLRPGRVLIFGESEIRYLESLEPPARVTALRLALTLDFPCVLITGGFTPPPELLAEAEHARVPLLKTAIVTPMAREIIERTSEPKRIRDPVRDPSEGERRSRGKWPLAASPQSEAASNRAIIRTSGTMAVIDSIATFNQPIWLTLTVERYLLVIYESYISR